jgi:hypothetical protein
MIAHRHEHRIDSGSKRQIGPFFAPKLDDVPSISGQNWPRVLERG